MDSSVTDIVHEDDTLLRNEDDADAGSFNQSPFLIPGFAPSSRSRPPTTPMTTTSTRFGQTGCIMSDRDKENLNISENMRLGSSNLNMEPQRMKRSRRAGGCNFRKSLAWDKAFFTEEGVLSPFELSMISGTPSKLGGRDLSGICKEPKTPMHTNSTPSSFQTIESKSLRKLSSGSTKGNRRVGEGSILQQKSPALASQKSKKLISTASASNRGRKDGSCFKSLAPTSHKRLLTTSPAKPPAQKPKIPRTPVLKPVGHLISSTASNSDTTHLKHNHIFSPALSVQKQLGKKGSSNTRGTSNAPKIVSQHIPKPSRSSDQRTRKNRADSSSQEQSSTNHQVSNVKEITSSNVISGKILPARLEENDGTSKAAVSVHADYRNLCTIGHPVQHQAAKPSGLRMPSPSLRYFSEPKISMKNSLGQRNIQPSNLPDSAIPGSHNLGAACNVPKSEISKTTMDRIPDSRPIQPSSISSILHNLGVKGNVVQSKIQKETIDRVHESCLVQPCSVSSVNSPKSVELVVGLQTLLGEKPVEQITKSGFEEADKHFVEHEHTFLSIEGVDGKDNKSVSPIGEGKYNETDLFQSSIHQFVSPVLNKISDCHVIMQGQYDLSVMNRSAGLESEVQEGHCQSYVTSQVPQVYDGLFANIEDQLKRSFSSERAFDYDIVNTSIMEEDKVDKLLVAREEFPASLEKIVDMEKPVHRAYRRTVEDDGFRIVIDDDRIGNASPLDVELSASLDIKPQADDPCDPYVAEYSNDTHLIGQNTHSELQMSPRVCKSISQVDAAICDANLSFSPSQGLASTAARLSTDRMDRQHKSFDELVREPLISYEVTSGSFKNKHSSKDLVTFEDRKFSYRRELQLSPSTVPAEPLMPDQAMSGSFQNQHTNDVVGVDDRELNFQEQLQLNPSTCEDQTLHAASVCTLEVPSLVKADLVIVDDRELSFQEQFQLNPSICEDETIHAAAVCTVEGPSLVNETMPVSLGKDMCEIDLVIHDGRELIDSSYMEALLLPNKHEIQTENSPYIKNTLSYSPHGNGDLSLPLKASGDRSMGVDKLETDRQMNQDPQKSSLEIEQVEDHFVLIDFPSRNDNRSDQTILKELQLSTRTSEDCTTNCDIHMSSSPCQTKSSTVSNASKDESDEQFASANQHEIFHDTDVKDAKIQSKILKDGKNPSQLVIRPPADVAPFSDEWVAAVEAAGEEILTLKTGPVQNSPPSRLSPEPGPWSPVKRKNNQGIGPYDCTKYTGGQH